MKKLFSMMCLLALTWTTSAATFNIYINNQSGWEQTALYAWADGRSDSQLLGSWPGMQATGTEGEYLVFTVDESLVPANLIFNNNNNGSQTADFALTEAADIYLVATATKLTVEGAPAPTYANFIYVEDQIGWNAMTMYAYDSERTTILGGWPGKGADDIVEIEGITYKAFGVEADFAPATIILSNNGNAQLGDFTIEEQRDYYLVATLAGVAEQGTELPDLTTYHIHITNQTGWDSFFLYEWGSPNEITGAWPGASGEEFTFQAVAGSTVALHLIFHNNIGEGKEGDQRLTLDLTEARDYSIVVTATEAKEDASAVELTPAGETTVKRIVNDQLLIIRDGKTYNILGTQL